MHGPAEARTARSRQLRRAQTDAERRLWYRLGNRQTGGHKFVRQEPIGPYFADFACRERKLVVELDSVHDLVGDAYLASRGWRVLRFWNGEVFTNLEGVLDTILAALEERTQPPLPASGERASEGSKPVEDRRG
jgi:very-short-patch-repair endonuclease